MTKKTGISAPDIGLALAGKGFFPETLPPCFTSLPIAGFLRQNRSDITSARLQKRKSAKLIRYNSTKTNGARRIFSTPHPLNYLFICDFLSEHWSKVNGVFNKPLSISASIPEFSPDNEVRSIKITPFSELDIKVHKAIKHSSFLVKTDIAQFYPSIYTHSVPWAYHSKTASKKDRKHDSKTLFFNELDYHLRNCQDGQTHGLFVGPDAARIISEMLLTSVDKKFLADASADILGAVRYVDDYYIGVDSEAGAASVIASLERGLNEFELTLNDSKTKVIPTSHPMGDLWPLELHRLSQQFLSDDEISEARLSELFNVALVAVEKSGVQSPIKLLLRQIDRFEVGQGDSFAFIEPYFLRFIHHFSHAIDYICMIVGARALSGEQIDQSAWKEVIDHEIPRYARLGQHHEVAWLFWLSIVGRLKLEVATLEAIMRTENAHLTAMAVTANSEKRMNHKLGRSFQGQLDMTSEDWLLYHQAAVAGLAKSKSLVNDELGLHDDLLVLGESLIDFAIGEEKLKSGSVIDGVRYGYDLDNEDFDPDEDDDDNGGAIFVPSMQDY